MRAKTVSPIRIANTPALTALFVGMKKGDAIEHCNVCGEAAVELELWRECDPWDKRIMEDAALVYVDPNHPACLKKIEKHVRLYVEDAGLPGSFPNLCRDCRYRDGVSCTHRDLKKNGGTGLRVTLADHGIIMCGRGSGGCSTPVRQARTCDGFVGGRHLAVLP